MMMLLTVPPIPNLTPSDLALELDLDPHPSTISVVSRNFLTTLFTPRIRPMREFAEAEIKIPTGPYKGRRYSTTRQPYARLWFDLVESGLWPRIFSTGPSQSGKTLTCFVIPALYHLFEIGEDVGVLIPQIDMAKDKWEDDIKPVIMASRYKDLMPTKGPGSRGGSISNTNSVVHFKNGTQLKFFTGGGDDKKRAGKSLRVLLVTEVDGMDEGGGESREGDKISQTEKRTASYGSRRRIYGECTVTIPEGRTWREYQAGTQTRIVLKCVSCGAGVTPERDDLIGWDDAENVVDARHGSHFSCPACGVLWSDEQRTAMNETAIVLHRGQDLDEDWNIVGEMPKTETLGFRWSAINNEFLTTGDIAVELYNASLDPDQDNAERILNQFVFATPFIDDSVPAVTLDEVTICARYTSIPRGHIPPDALYVSAAMDLGKRLCHWIVLAWLEGGTCRVIDYGKIKVQSDTLGVEMALAQALREFYNLCEHGWEIQGRSTRRSPDRVMLDSGWQGKDDAYVVYQFIRAVGLTGRYWPSKGYGTDTRLAGIYHQPKSIGGEVQLIGENYHINLLKEQGVYLVHINADWWKSFVHKRLTTPVGQPGAMTLFHHPEKHGHHELAKHITAEKVLREYVKDRGYVEKFHKIRKANHFLDALYLACMAGYLAGARVTIIEVTDYIVLPDEPEPRTPPEQDKSFIRQSARPAGSGVSWIRRTGK